MCKILKLKCCLSAGAMLEFFKDCKSFCPLKFRGKFSRKSNSFCFHDKYRMNSDNGNISHRQTINISLVSSRFTKQYVEIFYLNAIFMSFFAFCQL